MKINKISKSKAVELIEANKGKFFTVTFTKKDNTLRTINCTRKVGATTNLGYLSVWSVQDKGLRSIDPRTITGLKLDNNEYKVS
jgi:hypothetical protein